MYDERLLLDMLTYRRPWKSKGEEDFIRKFITGVVSKPRIDGFGNIVIVTDPLSKTLFSCHTDTVHRDDDRQTVDYDPDFQWASKSDNEALGADDAAGCFILLSMIAAKVPGTYVFHRGEECGGQGSKWRRKHREADLRRFDRAIAFDRRGDTSVISRQGGTRTASDEFCEALATLLGHGYEVDDTGVYTDTKEYIQFIAECTNVSVGYNNEHSGRETLDVAHVLWLADTVKTIDWESLPVVRDPNAAEDYRSRFSTGYRPSWLDKYNDTDWSHYSARPSFPTPYSTPVEETDTQEESVLPPGKWMNQRPTVQQPLDWEDGSELWWEVEPVSWELLEQLEYGELLDLVNARAVDLTDFLFDEMWGANYRLSTPPERIDVPNKPDLPWLLRNQSRAVSNG